MDNIHNHIINDTADIPPVPPSEIFSNEFILKYIFKNLMVRDLKHCRGVNILWCREATNSLLRNHELSPIEIENEENGNFQFRSQFQKELSMDAERFVAMVLTSISFPCNTFCLPSYALQNTTIQFFLNRYGLNIKELEIWNDADEELQGPIAKMIEDLLTKQVTKLQCLLIEAVSISSSTEFLNSKKLKNLTKVIVGTYKSNEFMGRILNAAVNLKIITCDCTYDFNTLAILKAIIGFGKAHLLDRCDFFIETSSKIEEQIRVYEAVVNSKPKLKAISLDSSTYDFFPGAEAYVPLMRLASVISKCFQLNSDSLVVIFNLDNFLHLPGLRIPRLPKVKSLKVRSQMHPLKLMEGDLLALNFVETFPNLKSIKFSYDGHIDNEDVSNYLGNVIPCLNVTNCNYPNWYSHSLPSTLFEYFGEKFPNLTHLKCRVNRQFVEASQNIWKKLTQLEFLEIQIGYTSASVEANYPGLEAAFTGFSSETCLRLKNCIAEGKDVSLEFPNLEELRINPSILNLIKLTVLNLTFDRQGISSVFWDNWAPASPLLTAVTGQFAFALCPKLRVNIKFGAFEGNSNAWSNESNPFLGVAPFVNMYCKEWRCL